VTGHTLGLIGSGAGGVEEIRHEIAEPLIAGGWRIAVTLTPTAATWLQASGEVAELERVTGLPVRSEPRLPGDERPHPPVDAYAVVPASATTIAKMVLGIGDNQALTQLCEAIGTEGLPVLAFPRVNAAHARQPAWKSHIEALHAAGVHLVYGDDVWPLHEPRSAPGRPLPWAAIREAIEHLLDD
jgi:hypothetical protein